MFPSLIDLAHAVVGCSAFGIIVTLSVYLFKEHPMTGVKCPFLAGSVVRLTVNSHSFGDARCVYAAGGEFEFKAVMTEYPSCEAEVKVAVFGNGQALRAKTSEPMAIVHTLSADRSRLIFKLADLELVQTAKPSKLWRAS